MVRSLRTGVLIRGGNLDAHRDPWASAWRRTPRKHTVGSQGTEALILDFLPPGPGERKPL